MQLPDPTLDSALVSRRELLTRCGTGLGMVGLASLLSAAETPVRATNPLAPRAPHFKPRARRIIHLYMNGGPSQVDTFDPKPALQKYQGQRPASTAGLEDGKQHRRADAIAVQVQALRQERSGDQRAVRSRAAGAPTISA